MIISDKCIKSLEQYCYIKAQYMILFIRIKSEMNPVHVCIPTYSDLIRTHQTVFEHMSE